MGGCITAMASRDLAAGVQRATGLELSVTGGYNVTVVRSSGVPSSNRSVRLSEETWRWLADQAEAQRRSVNWIVGELVEAARNPPPFLIAKEAADKMAEALRRNPNSKPGQMLVLTDRASVPLIERRAFNPQPKKGKK